MTKDTDIKCPGHVWNFMTEHWTEGPSKKLSIYVKSWIRRRFYHCIYCREVVMDKEEIAQGDRDA